MSETNALQTAKQTGSPSQLWETFGNNFGVNASAVAQLLASVVISVGKQEPAPTAQEVAACAIVCNIHHLNPFTKEIHCFRSKGKMLFAIGIDGWSKIAQRQPQMNGVEWESHYDKDGKFYAMTCKIYRRDWSMPLVVTEYLDECRRDTEPWNKSPRRMMRNRSYSQAVRMAFAIGGLLDETEADQITDGRFSSAVLEGERVASPSDPTELAIREHATRLNYNQARLQPLRQQYADNPEGLLEYLKGEVKKMQRPQIQPPASRGRQKQQQAPPVEEQSQEQPQDEADENQQQGMDFQLDQSKMPSTEEPF